MPFPLVRVVRGQGVASPPQRGPPPPRSREAFGASRPARQRRLRGRGGCPRTRRAAGTRPGMPLDPLDRRDGSARGAAPTKRQWARATAGVLERVVDADSPRRNYTSARRVRRPRRGHGAGADGSRSNPAESAREGHVKYARPQSSRRRAATGRLRCARGEARLRSARRRRTV